jgi:nitroimidazol reductase NimA-like FMN-containing flavoprotein (pyridoxamine 5'-phosphate oxidase superfamily)
VIKAIRLNPKNAFWIIYQERGMRNKKREVSDLKEIESFIAEAAVCRLGLCQGDTPYVVPLNFGYKDGCFYFHGAPEGQKIDFIKKNNKVCVEIDVGCKLIEADLACKWTTHYKSVIAFGRAFFLAGSAEKKKALDIILGHYSAKAFTYPDELINKIAVLKVQVESITGKKIGY